MTLPIQRPDRKTRSQRPGNQTSSSRTGPGGLGHDSRCLQGVFELQVCTDCGCVQYPPREACGQCLSVDLKWQAQNGAGNLLSSTTLHHSNDLYFRDRLPWRLGLVQLDAGPTVMTHLHGEVGQAPVRVQVGARLDRAGQAVLITYPEQGGTHMADDKMLREMTSDPKYRKALVTDGKTALGQAIVKALILAGADTVWVGQSEPWKQADGLLEIASMPQVFLVPLDLTDGRSVTELAGEIGGKVDMVINNAEMHRNHGIAGRRGTDSAKAEMEINYFGLLRLAQAFGPALAARAADGTTHATAWVNLLSIYALSNFPAHGTFSASKAAAYSLAQCLRAEMQPSGIRVINVFPGPIDDEWNQQIAPKLSPESLAAAIIKALRDGVEDVYPGDIAQEWLQRWRDNPKALEREISKNGA